MKKLIIRNGLLLLLGCFTRVATAQFFSGGLAGGISTGDVRIAGVGRVPKTISGNDLIGWELGGYVKFQVKPFYVKPQLLYGFREGYVSFVDQDNKSHTVIFNAHRLVLPVMFGLHVVGPFCIEGGPVYHKLINYSQYYEITTARLGSRGTGYRVGVAYDVGPIILNFAYEGDVGFTTNEREASLSEPNKYILGAAVRLGQNITDKKKKEEAEKKK